MLDLKSSIPISKYSISSGLELNVVPRHNSPIISLNLSYKVGSKDEKRGKTGFAHLFEHLMFEGSKHVPKGEFDKLCSTAGGTNNAYTTYDWTSYIMSIPSHQLELALWLESDRMLNFDVKQDALDNQKKVVYEEILQTVENQPYGLWREKLAELAFSQESSYSWEVHGSKDDVMNCELKDASDFFNKFYKPSNAVLSLVGDIDPNKAFELTEKYFKGNKNGKVEDKNEFKHEFLQGGKEVTFDDSVPLAAAFVSFHAPGFLSDDIFVGDILTNIYGTGRSSIIYDKLIYQDQTASQAGAFFDKREFSSLITFYAIANSPSTSADELGNELSKIIYNNVKSGFQYDLINKAINQLTTETANEIMYSSGIADTLSNLSLFRNNPEMIHEILQKYNEIKIEQLQDLAQKILIPENSIVIKVEPKR